MPTPRCAFGLLLLGFFAVGPGGNAAASVSASLQSSVQDTLGVPEREDHSPSLVTSPLGRPALVWVATAPDTNASGRFDEVAFAQRDSAGWSAPIVVGGPAPALFTPEIVYDLQGGRWIAWAQHDGTDSSIRLRRDLEDSTWTFTLDDPTQPDLEPSLCAGESEGVVVVWQGWRAGNYEILFSTGDETGFAAPVVISEAPTSDREPEIVRGGGFAWIVWSSYRGPAYNLLSRRFDGTSLTPTVAMTTSSRARNLHPQIAWDPTNEVLWVASLWVNQGWPGINQHEFPGFYDLGSPRLRAFDGAQLYLPPGLDADLRYPLAPMETLGFVRPDFGNGPIPDRTGEGFAVVPLPGGGIEVLHRQNGALVEGGVTNSYWTVSGARLRNDVWSSPAEFLERRTAFPWDDPAATVDANSTMWIAWSADRRTPPIVGGPNNPNLFGHDANLVLRGEPVDTTFAGPLELVPIGLAAPPSAVAPVVRPQFSIADSGEVRTLLWGDNHRHSVDLSWDAAFDPGIKQTLFYSLDWLGHDFLSTSDHAERFSKAIWAMVPRWSMIYDVPGRFRLFPGYERSMRAGAGGGDQNALYRDPAQFTEATAAYPSNADWDVLYNAMAGRDVLCVPNQTPQCGAVTRWHELAGGDPSNLPAPLRLVEVYQALRKSFEYPGCPDQTTFCTVSPDSGWVNVMLAMGLRIGLIAASDHTIVAGYAGVLAKSASREDIFEALYDRHCFAASQNTRMNVDFRVAGEIMGSEVSTSSAPEILIHVASQSPLAHIEVNKNGNPSWFSASSSAAETTIVLTDVDANPVGTTSYYYLRVRDSAERIVWTSPVWVTHESPPIGTGVHPEASTGGEPAIALLRNPTRGAAVRFRLEGVGADGGVVRLHDVGGRLLREFGVAPGAPTRNLDWDRRDRNGGIVAPGVVYAVFQTGGVTRSTKVTLLR